MILNMLCHFASDYKMCITKEWRVKEEEHELILLSQKEKNGEQQGHV